MDNNQKEMIRNRIRAELQKLQDTGGIMAELSTEGEQDYVLYRDLATSGASKNLPASTNVLVSVPNGYPSSPIDMPALLVGSLLAPHLVGGSNPQNTVQFQNSQWRFLSFHPYSGQGAPNWNPNKHGFHDYYQHLYTWLHKI